MPGSMPPTAGVSIPEEHRHNHHSALQTPGRPPGHNKPAASPLRLSLIAVSWLTMGARCRGWLQVGDALGALAVTHDESARLPPLLRACNQHAQNLVQCLYMHSAWMPVQTHQQGGVGLQPQAQSDCQDTPATMPGVNAGVAPKGRPAPAAGVAPKPPAPDRLAGVSSHRERFFSGPGVALAPASCSSTANTTSAPPHAKQQY
jgi:hypothetical protein